MHSISAEAKLSHLEALESESIHILRESRPECRNPSLLFWAANIRFCCSDWRKKPLDNHADGVARKAVYMRQPSIDSNELNVNLERLIHAELRDWAHGMDYFGDQPFVWDGHHGLDSNQYDDELLPNLSEHARPALPGDRRRCRGGAKNCRLT